MVLNHKIQIETNRGEKVFCLADLHMRIDRKVVLKMTQERFPDTAVCKCAPVCRGPRLLLFDALISGRLFSNHHPIIPIIHIIMIVILELKCIVAIIAIGRASTRTTIIIIVIIVFFLRDVVVIMMMIIISASTVKRGCTRVKSIDG